MYNLPESAPIFPSSLVFQQKGTSPLKEQSLHLCTQSNPFFPTLELQSYNYPLFFLHQASSTFSWIMPHLCIFKLLYMTSLKKQIRILLWTLYPPLGITPFFYSLHSQTLLKWFKKMLSALFTSHPCCSIHSNMTSASITSNIHSANPTSSLCPHPTGPPSSTKFCSSFPSSLE